MTQATMKVTPIPDEGRTLITRSRFTLDVNSMVTGTSPAETDAILDNFRQALGHSGGTLNVAGIAVGRHIINDYDGDAWDVRNGPWPGDMTVTPMGGGITALIQWSVSWEVPDCANAVYTQELGFLYHNFAIGYSIDESGYTTRTITGELVVPQNRAELGGQFPESWADNSREYLLEKFPLNFAGTGFRRSYPNFGLSKDRATLTYTITDRELGENAPPPGCVTADADIGYATTHVAGLYVWIATLNGKYEVAKGYTIQPAVDGFLELLAEKLQFARDVAQAAPDGDVKGVVPTAFSMKNPSIYGKKVAEFSCSWTMTCPLPLLLQRAGIWSRPADSDFSVWIESLENTALHIRGLARLGGYPGIQETDDIQNLCRPADAIPDEESDDEEPYPDDEDPEWNELVGELMTPDEENSWIWYECRLEVDQDDGVTEYRTLPTEPLTDATDRVGSFDAMDAAAVGSLMSGGGGSSSGSTGGIEIGSESSGDSSSGSGSWIEIGSRPVDTAGTTWAERRVRPVQVVYLVGRAGRYGFPIPQPRLDYVSINGTHYPVIQANREEAGERFIQQSYASPVIPVIDELPPKFEAIWRLRYVIVGDPPAGRFDPPANPYTGELPPPISQSGIG